MIKKGMTRSEIEKELQGKGDYVQIYDIRRFLTENPTEDLKTFLNMRLVEVYEKRMMFSQAAQIYGTLAMNSGHSNKIDYLLKETENYVKAGFLDQADASASKALSEAKPLERTTLAITLKGFYKKQAEVYEKERRKSKAAEIYEKLLSMKDISDFEKKEISNKLMMLYKDLGDVRKYLGFKTN